MIKIDPYTNEEFYPKRSNQIFASRETQIAFNNEKSRNKRELKSPIDKSLENNRKILERILGENEEVIKSKDYLLGAGFDFTVFSHRLKIDEKIIQAVYNCGIYKSENDKYTLIKL